MYIVYMNFIKINGRIKHLLRLGMNLGHTIVSLKSFNRVILT